MIDKATVGGKLSGSGGAACAKCLAEAPNLLACEHTAPNAKKHDPLSRSTHFQRHQLKSILPS
jgi:hypothetical protein